MMTYAEYMHNLGVIGMLPGQAIGGKLVQVQNDWIYHDKDQKPRTPPAAPWHVPKGEEEKWAKTQGVRKASWFVPEDMK
jgi:hypothetical protein